MCVCISSVFSSLGFKEKQVLCNKLISIGLETQAVSESN